MHFFEQLKRPDIPIVNLPHVERASSLTDRLLAGYVKLFGERLKPLKPLAMVNGTMPVYDLTQPPMESKAGARVLRAGFNYVVRKKSARPINMVLMLNSACNMKCRHCSARHYIQSGRKPLEAAEVKDLVDQFIDLGGASAIYSGGEPTLHRDLLELVDHVDKNRAVISIFTNGSRLADLGPELKSAGLFGTLVSLDSHDGKLHDERRNHPGAFAGALKGIAKLKELGMLVGTSSYMTRPDLQDGEFDKQIALATELGVHQVFMFDAVPTGAFLDERELVLTPDDRAQVRELTKRQNALPSGPGVMGQSWVNSCEGFGCFAGFYQLYVTASGDVCPCDFTPITFGNIREEPLEKIWERMRQSEDWGERFSECRMQDHDFRRKTVELIPPEAQWPIPYETIKKLQAEARGRGEL